MNSIAQYPRQGVFAVGAQQVEELRNLASNECQVVDFKGSFDQGSAIMKIAEVLRFPVYFGGNLDALFDCLTDLSTLPQEGLVLFIRGLQQIPLQSSREKILDVFRDAAEEWRLTGQVFQVFYCDGDSSC